MNANAIIERLERFGAVFPAAARLPSEEDARWKPRPEDWSVLEICCHMLDEEREDFRARLQSTLEDPTRKWPPLDLEQVSERRGYSERNLAETLAAWVEERNATVKWLRELAIHGALGEAGVRGSYSHPSGRVIHVGDLLASWSAHDALHLRQVAKRLHQLAGRDAAQFTIEYAGEWRA